MINVIGVMSGSSLDGLDIGVFSFQEKNSKYDFKFLKFKTFQIPKSIFKQLKAADTLGESALQKLDIEYGEYIAKCILRFLENSPIKAELISVHGHTVFHEPHKGVSLQIGNAQTIANYTNITTIDNFRIYDIEKGGQGAPLVPAGDMLLFGNYNACINLGGIANITLNDSKKAFDITYCNRALNFLASKLKLKFDAEGKIARGGKLIAAFLKQLEEIDYLNYLPPKSLNNQNFELQYLPIFQNFLKSNVADLLHTYNIFLSTQIGKFLKKNDQVLITGGGAHNHFLIELLQNNYCRGIVIPPKKLINGKESLVFAFLGYLKYHNKINVYSCFTGASENSYAGDIHHPEN